ncbi:hypothetical protein [Levilactobacillus lindianensis]|uniref:hypothetical protein n=1 Tax=Levilactobacillus lindianensis TaxID=2486018 RepID=UPI000F74A54D|nr:hypothetical protein [Levilactobacillus lindianensis]
MQSSLKKSLYLGLAALSFASVAAVSTNASAKSYAKAGAETDLTVTKDDTNVESTGTNALFTKPGTTKGAKVVASKATMKKLANSGKSADYFWAYRTTTTNKGAVYYKVVSMNGKYRGYVYAGKKAGEFSRGIVKADTVTPNTTDANISKRVYFKAPGTHNVTWTAPKYTEHKASKRVVNTKPFAKDTLTVTKAETKTRENTLYYYVQDAEHPSVSGWIYAGAVTTDDSAAFNDSTDVKVEYVNADGKTVASQIATGLNADGTTTAATTAGTPVGTALSTQITAEVANKTLANSGYTYAATNANAAALLTAKTGDTVKLNVTENTAATTPLKLVKANSSSTATDTADLSVYSDGDTASATTVVVPKLSAGFKGADGAAFTSATLKAFATDNNLTTLYTPTITTGTGDTATKTYYKYTLVDAKDGNYGTGNTATLVYSQSDAINGTSPADANSSTDAGTIWAK